MAGRSRGGFGSWGQGGSHQGSYRDRGPSWQGPSYDYDDPIMDSFDQSFGMRSLDIPLPIHDRPPAFHSEFDYPDGRSSAFERNAGWQSEREAPFWDSRLRQQGFPRPFDRSNARTEDTYLNIRKKPRIFSPVYQTSERETARNNASIKTRPYNKSASKPSPSSSSSSSSTKVKDTKKQNGDANKAEVKVEGADSIIQLPRPGTVFSCSLCRFETQDDTLILKHFRSSQHNEILKHLYIFLPRQRVDFIQEYLLFEKTRVSKERKRQNLPLKKDSIEGMAKEHFFHRVEVIRCVACDVFIQDLADDLIEHAKSESHVEKSKVLNKEIKNGCLGVAKTLMQDKNILEMLKQHSRGLNPFKAIHGIAPHAAGSHEVLVAEEDDHVPLDDGDDAEDINEDPGDTQDEEGPAPVDEGSSQDIVPLNEPKEKESNDSNDKLLETHDSDGTFDDEEAAEAP